MCVYIYTHTYTSNNTHGRDPAVWLMVRLGILSILHTAWRRGGGSHSP